MPDNSRGVHRSIGIRFNLCCEYASNAIFSQVPGQRMKVADGQCKNLKIPVNSRGTKRHSTMFMFIIEKLFIFVTGPAKNGVKCGSRT